MIKRWLANANKATLITFSIIAAFGCYLSMYAFRKPFAVGTFETYTLWGTDYKIILIIAQVLGYMTSKFIGIKLISEMKREHRAVMFLILMGIAEGALFLFAIVPYPYNFLFLFFNGLPLGMIWGIVFSYLEGRSSTELLGAGLSASFIVGSGFVKSVGKMLLDWGATEFWMPFLTGAIFIIPSLLFFYMLEQIPPPSAEDETLRTKREQMTAQNRKAFFSNYAFGLIVLVLFYMGLTAYRDFRDNFARELWDALGYGNTPEIFTLAEVPIAVAVLIMLGLTMYIKNNQKAFYIYHYLILASLVMMGVTTFMLQQQAIDPALWMILMGLGLYVGYVPFGSIFFDRMLAAFKYIGTAGFMIYVADAFGYFGSVLILLYKNFGQPDISWLNFFIYSSYGISLLGIICLICSLIYFKPKLKAVQSV